MRRWVVFAAVLAGAAIGAGVVAATVVPTLIADTNTVREKIIRNQFTPSPDQKRFEAMWHAHPGPAIVQVISGHLKIVQGENGKCWKAELGKGDTYIEVPEVPVNAYAHGPVTWETTFILPNSTPGGPDRHTATDPCPKHHD
jgi:hypothetical protein